MANKDSAYDSDMMEGGEKCVIVGDASVGKTSLILRYIDKPFENVKPTVGCDHFEKDVMVKNNKIKLSIWDTAGQERFRGLTNSYYKKAKCVMIVYDITKKSSFDKIEFWKEEIINFAEPDVIIVLVGSKLDLQDKRTVMREEAINCSNKNKFAYFTEVSSFENQGNGIQILFSKIAELIMDKIGVEGNSKTNDHPNDKPKKVDQQVQDENKKDEGCKC